MCPSISKSFLESGTTTLSTRESNRNLIGQLKSENQHVRSNAFRTLLNRQLSEADTPEIIQLSKSEDETIQVEAISLLGATSERKPYVSERLTAILQNPNASLAVRAAAADALIKQTGLSEDAIQEVIDALKNENEDAKLTLITLLGEVLGERAALSKPCLDRIVDDLIEFLQDASCKVRRGAAMALAHLQNQLEDAIPTRVIQILCTLLNDTEPTVKRAAMNTLCKLNCKELEESVVETLLRYLIQTSGDKTIFSLLKRQSKPNLSHKLDALDYSKDVASYLAVQKVPPTIKPPLASPAEAA